MLNGGAPFALESGFSANFRAGALTSRAHANSGITELPRVLGTWNSWHDLAGDRVWLLVGWG